MFRRPIVRVAAIVGAVLIVAAGWYLGSPLFIRTTADEALPTLRPSTTGSPGTGATPAAADTRVLSRGELGFVDTLHNGKGPVSLVRVGTQTFVRFENVSITNAPDIHVYLSRETGGKWSEASSLYLGALKATNGSFNYEVPAGTDTGPYRSVVVWCRAFSMLITWADLTAA